MPHSFAVQETSTRHVPDLGGHPCEVSRHANACTIICDHPHSWSTMPVPDLPNLAALARASVIAMCPKPFDTDGPTIITNTYATAHALRRRARHRAMLHTPQTLCTLETGTGIVFHSLYSSS
ncbi:hypothetical protein EDB89DRAFT_1909177 [Lactarius sanguifluus]|nr:hypothetical protein EDB89DRAFT_1909177 [Lactarius sanguifluus]